MLFTKLFAHLLQNFGIENNTLVLHFEQMINQWEVEALRYVINFWFFFEGLTLPAVDLAHGGSFFDWTGQFPTDESG